MQMDEWICSLNDGSDNPTRKIVALLQRMKDSDNEVELLCLQSELLTTIARHCPVQKSTPSANARNEIELDAAQLHKMEQIIMGNDELLDLELMELVQSSTNHSSEPSAFRTAKQVCGTNVVSKASNGEQPCGAQQKPELKGLDQKLVDSIMQDAVQQLSSKIEWDQIAGLDHAKRIIQEIIIWPMLRPDIFKGLRGPPRGLLLFGPPGTGKTMLGRCIASQAGATFFSICASSLTSKWMGEGEKMVRTLFQVARSMEPAVVFVDEIDSLLTQRQDGENEATRRIKTEFLVQFDGIGHGDSTARLLVIGATNRPQELDEAARRRLVKRLYIPLPDASARLSLITGLLNGHLHSLSEQDFSQITQLTEGYSGSDLHALCKEVVMQPLRCVQDILTLKMDQVRPITLQDFHYSLSQIRASVSERDLLAYQQWNEQFGCL